jgi:hypothetical protein
MHMTKTEDWGKFCALVRAADETISARPRSEPAMALMFEALLAFDIADVARAVSHHVRKSPYPVKPSDVASFLEGSPEERSQAAWRTFLRAVGRYGYYDSVRFPDPAYHYAIQELGGWERLCEELHCLTDREAQFRAREFRQPYETGLRVASWDGAPGKVRVPQYLWGFFERDNREQRRLGFVPEAVDVLTGEKLSLLVAIGASGEAVMSLGRGE